MNVGFSILCKVKYKGMHTIYNTISSKMCFEWLMVMNQCYYGLC